MSAIFQHLAIGSLKKIAICNWNWCVHIAQGVLTRFEDGRAAVVFAMAPWLIGGLELALCVTTFDYDFNIFIDHE